MDGICSSAVSQNTTLLGKQKILLAGFDTLLKFPPCCSNSFDIIGIPSEVFSEAKILHALKQEVGKSLWQGLLDAGILRLSPQMQCPDDLYYIYMLVTSGWTR